MNHIRGPGTEYEIVLPHLLPRALDPEAMLAAARQLIREYPTPHESTESAEAISQASYMLLCAGKAHEAKEILEKTIKVQIANNQESPVTRSELRLVQVLQQLGSPEAAVALAQDVLSRQPRDGPLRHFALHHLGKALIQTGASDQAQLHLQEALALRLASGKQEYVASTQQALDLIAIKKEA